MAARAAALPSLRRPKLYYALYFAALAALQPFLVLLFRKLGLSGSEIGVLVGVQPLVMLLAAPGWGTAADATGRRRALMSAATLAAAACALLLPRTHDFAALLALVVVLAAAMAPIIPLFDAAVLDLLGARTDRYGRQRVWGAVGWGLAAPLVGVLADRVGLGAPFAVYAGLMLASLAVLWSMPAAGAARGSPWRGLPLLASRPWLLLLAQAAVAGAGLAITASFLFVFMADLGASATLVGLALTAATVAEVPVFALAGRLLRRVGAGRLIAASLAVSGVRMLLYAGIADPWWVLPIQLLHGPAFAGLWVGAVQRAEKLAPPGLGSTAQALLSGTVFGLGAATGALLGGWLYDAYGARTMFRAAGVALLLSAAAGAAARAALQRAARTRPPAPGPTPGAFEPTDPPRPDSERSDPERSDPERSDSERSDFERSGPDAPARGGVRAAPGHPPGEP